MGDDDPDDDDAPTDYAPTELGAAIDETDAHRAWALANEPDELPRRVTPQRITALAVAGSLVIGAASAVGLYLLDRGGHLRPKTTESVDSLSAVPESGRTSVCPSSRPRGAITTVGPPACRSTEDVVA